jgi:hypothetical protein
MEGQGDQGQGKSRINLSAFPRRPIPSSPHFPISSLVNQISEYNSVSVASPYLYFLKTRVTL